MGPGDIAITIPGYIIGIAVQTDIVEACATRTPQISPAASQVPKVSENTSEFALAVIEAGISDNTESVILFDPESEFSYPTRIMEDCKNLGSKKGRRGDDSACDWTR